VANLSEVVDGVEAVRLAARHTLRAGAHQIKIFVSGGISSPSDPIWMTQYSEDEIKAAVAEAKSRRTYVMAHAYAGDAILRAVRSGVRTIEHGNLLDKEAANEMARAGAYLIPTLVTYDSLAKAGQGTVPAVTLAKLKEVHKLGREAVALARQTGVSIGFGTDLLGDMHAEQLFEFRLRAEVDRPIDILRSATSINAQILQSNDLGRVSVGVHADLIVIDGDPLKDISLMWREGGIALVMKAGKIVRNDLRIL
jgi:imidazolonepropionase-like amidohydrolase